ncbi:MAG: 6-phosphogluconolactonase [Candidatus Levyibacteriota bacterium]
MKKRTVQSLAESVGNIWKGLQAKYTREGKFNVAAPLSSTPIPIYHWIIENATQFENWEKVNFVLMDEMLQGDNKPFKYIPVDDSASYEGFAKRNLLEPLYAKVSIKMNIIKPDLSLIDDFDTPIDLLILALGIKGNYANVMPYTPEETRWHISHLIPEFRLSHTQKGSHSFEGAYFRDYGMSLGHKQVLEAKNVIVVISGEKKRALTQQLLSYTTFHTEFPLSIIYHPKVTNRVNVFITKEVLE